MNLIPAASGPPDGGPRRTPIRIARTFPLTFAAALGAIAIEALYRLAAGAGAATPPATAGVLPLRAALVALALRASLGEPAGSPRRRAWRWLSVAFLLLLSADVVRLLPDGVLREAQTVSLGALSHFAAGLAFLVGLWTFGSPVQHATARLRFVLDSLTVVASAAILLAHFVVRPGLAAGGAHLLIAGYPAGDLVALVGVAALRLRPSPGLEGRTLAGFGIGLLVALSADGLWVALGHDVAGPAQAWPAALAAVSALAMLAGVESHRPAVAAGEAPVVGESLEPSRLHPLPYIAAVIAWGTLVLECAEMPPRPCWDLALGSLGITVVVMARQVLAVRENDLLWRDRAGLLGEARLSALVRYSTDTIWILDREGVVCWASPSSRSMLSTPPEEIVGRTFVELLGSRSPEWPRNLLRRALATPQEPVRGEDAARLPGSGAEVRLEIALTNLLADRAVGGVVVNLRDVTERALLEEQLAHQAFHDPLTGLCNRLLFNDRVRLALRRSTRKGSIVAVCYVDLDDFSTVNDGLGHRAGDSLLEQIAGRLQSQIRETDTAGRLGGDEFAVLAEDFPEAGAAPVLGARLSEIFHKPFVVEGHEIVVTGSIGIAIAVPGDTSEGLLQKADSAMYEAKRAGRATYRVYEPSMHKAALESLRLQSRLKAAVDGGDIYLDYQPVVRLSDGELVGFEALARWSDAEFGLVPPSRFIPLAESSGLIVALGRHILRRAVEDLARARQRWPAIRQCILFLNISARQLADPAFPDDLLGTLTAAGVSPSLVCLEFREGAFVERTEVVEEALEALRRIGVQIGIDDFGTGYSSLDYLHRFRFDTLKIPRRFIAGIDGIDGDPTIASTIIRLGRGLDMPTVGEGIETAGEAETLRALGCELGQGNFFGRPAALVTMLSRFWDTHGLRQ